MSYHLRALVFDFDGTLVDSNEVKTQAFGTLFAEYGSSVQAQVIESHRRQEGVSRFVKFRQWHEELLGLPYSEEIGHKLSRRYQELVLEAVVHAPLIAGVAEFLQTDLPLPLYIASGTPEQELQVIVEQKDLSSHFQGVYGTPKTKAEILRQVATETTCSPNQLLMIGDAWADYEGAQAAGAQFLGIVRPQRANPFPPEVPVWPDLHGLADHLAHFST